MDKAIECSSSPVARRLSIQALRQWGTTCLIGVLGPMDIDANEIIIKQKSVLGALTFSKNMQRDCTNLVVERGINVDALFTH